MGHDLWRFEMKLSIYDQQVAVHLAAIMQFTHSVVSVYVNYGLLALKFSLSKANIQKLRHYHCNWYGN